MNSTLTPQHLLRTTADRAGTRESLADLVDSRTIRMEFSLAADTRRIFEALTVPEYMELWLSIPGCHSDCYSRASRLSGGFVFDHLCDSRPTVSVTGIYTMCQRRKIVFTWALSGLRGASTSFADIRLTGDFERSVLRLRHSGFTSDDDYSWHVALWSASLSRLSRLLGGAGSDSCASETRRRQRA